MNRSFGYWCAHNAAFLFATAALGMLGCSKSDDETRKTSAPLEAPRPTANAASIDPQSAIRKLRFGFRPEGKLLATGHTAHAVVIEGAKLKVQPVARPEPRELAPGQSLEPVVGAPFVLETEAITRGGTHFVTGAPSVGASGELIRSGTGVSEKLENREEGVELSWTFPRKPAGEGDLEVRLQTSGQRFTSVTPGGLHYEDPATDLGVRVGHATWIAANGERTSIDARRDGDDIVIRVPSRVLEQSGYRAVLDPLIGAEKGVDNPLAGGAAGSQSVPGLASDGSDYFVAWNDQRSSAYPQIIGTRVTAAGEVLDPNGIVISSGETSTNGAPAVAFDGTNYLVAYSTGSSIRARRVTTGGALEGAFIAVEAPAAPITPRSRPSARPRSSCGRIRTRVRVTGGSGARAFREDRCSTLPRSQSPTRRACRLEQKSRPTGTTGSSPGTKVQ